MLGNQGGATFCKDQGDVMVLCSMSCSSLDERGVWGRMDTCVCMVEFPRCSPEIITALLIDCTPIQIKKQKDQGDCARQQYLRF